MTALDATKHGWQAQEADLRRSGDVFYAWQYHAIYSTQQQRDNALLKPADRDRNHPWKLTELGL